MGETKERPILFSSPMVRSILEGRKTQTRRVVKNVPDWIDQFGYTCFTPKGSISGRGYWKGVPGDDEGPAEKFFPCPYGVPGDRLWVRETHLLDPPQDDTWDYTSYTDGEIENVAKIPDRFRNPSHVLYSADPRFDGRRGDYRWRPSIHMPRWASRITLEVTGVRVERLQEIRDADCEAEGVLPASEGDAADWRVNESGWRRTYRQLWDSIHGAGAWDASPWVWVIEFAARAAGGEG
jgi:hypothetical protein